MAKCQILPFREKSQVSGRDLAKQLPECHVSGKVGPKKMKTGRLDHFPNLTFQNQKEFLAEKCHFYMTSLQLRVLQ